MAKKYKTLANSCGPLVDKAWLELEDEFGEDQPVKSSYVVGKKDFHMLQEEDMLKTIFEFTEIRVTINRTPDFWENRKIGH